MAPAVTGYIKMGNMETFSKDDMRFCYRTAQFNWQHRIYTSPTDWVDKYSEGIDEADKEFNLRVERAKPPERQLPAWQLFIFFACMALLAVMVLSLLEIFDKSC